MSPSFAGWVARAGSGDDETVTEQSALARTRRPVVGAVCGTGYAVSHAWWTASGAPPFVRAESVLFLGWPLVIAAAVAALTCAVIGAGVLASRGAVARWLWCGAGWLAAAVLAGYGLLLWPGLAQLLMVPFGEPLSLAEIGTILLRALATGTAVLTAAGTRPVLRELRGGCSGCGRVHGRVPESRREPTAWWGYLGGYLAIAGLAVRLGPAVPNWIFEGLWDSGTPGGAAFVLFLVLMVLAGTVLPLALVHRWGRIWPAWILPWAGGPVPRWLVLGPGLMMSVGLLAYFGAGGTTALLLGMTSGKPLEAVEIGAYVLWGIGLAIASVSYGRLTRPECRARFGAGQV